MSFPGGPSHVETEFSKAFSAATDPDLSNFTATYRERLCQQALDADAGQQDRYQICLRQLPLSNIIPRELEYLFSASRQEPSVRDVNSGDLHDHSEDDTASRATTTETYMDLAQGTGQILSHQQKIVRNFAQNLHAPSSPPSYRNPPRTPHTPTRPPRSVPSQLPPAARALSEMTSVVPSRHATPVPQRPASNTTNLQDIVASAQHRRQSQFNAQQQQQQQQQHQQQDSQSDQERLRELQSQHESVLQEYTNHALQMLELELQLHDLQREMSYLAVAERGDGIS